MVGRFYRRPKTKNERSQSFENPRLVRKKRNAKNLPTNWDDLKISSREDRSWKRCTKKRKKWMK